MVDFTSALYLGLRHSSSSLRRWPELTTGVPAALGEPVEAREIARALADLQGCEAAILASSTLHLSWDLFGLLTRRPITILMDAGAYPITRWGVQRAAMRGATAQTFAHHDPAALEHVLAVAARDRTPVIATDGICPNCGRVAPLADYLAIARRRRGLLVIDDTQALGVLGNSPSARMPYGWGGGGALRWCGIDGSDVLVFASLAKGFGVPLAVLAGSQARVRDFEEQSLTRVHCSPPSIAVLRAAEHAVGCNRREGDARRAKLTALVRGFRRGLASTPGALIGTTLFPVQTLRPSMQLKAAELHARLLDRGVRTVLQRGEDGTPRVSFLLNARHTAGDIDSATSAARSAIENAPSTFTFIPKEAHHEEPVHHRV